MGNNTLSRLFKGELGWKTVAASIALVALVVLSGLDVITPEQFEQYVRVAEALGLVGLRDAVRKIKQ